MASVRAKIVESILRLTFRNKVGKSEDVAIERKKFQGSLFYKLGSMGAPSAISVRQFGGVDCEVIGREVAQGACVLLYLHGGVFTFRSPEIHRTMVNRITSETGASAVVVDYGLAPEHPFPAAIEDTVAVYEALLQDNVPSDRLVIIGDSCGGGMVVSTLLTLRDKKIPLPVCGVSLSPWADLSQSSRSIYTKAIADPLIDKQLLDWTAAHYLNGVDPKDPIASPVYANLTGLPPLLIQAGSNESILDDAKRLHETASRDGVASTLEIWDDMLHAWHTMTLIPESGMAIQSVADFIGKQLPHDVHTRTEEADH